MNYSELRKLQSKIQAAAIKEGLDPFPIDYHIVSHDKMSEVAAFDGMPDRYPHYRWGMSFDRLSKQHTFAMGKIYELILNTNPCIAYLQSSNDLVDTKLVLAHCEGHADFFRNSFVFRSTDLDGSSPPLNPSHTPTNYNPNRRWIDVFATNGGKVRKIIGRHGLEKVEQFIDCCLAIENLIDEQLPFTPQQKPVDRDEVKALEIPRFQAKSYMDSFINPEEYIEEQKKKLEEKQNAPVKCPEKPQRDVLGFLLKYAPLETWEHDILEIIRTESYYYLPQRLSKIGNEAAATFWEDRILMKHSLLDSSEIIDLADNTSKVLATSKNSLNPYKLGLELLLDIEDRWNRGAFGPEYDDCDDAAERANWNLRLGKGIEKVLEVRRHYTDAMLIDEFLTPDFVAKTKMFAFSWSNRNSRYEIESRDFRQVKDKLLFSLTNGGQPFITVDDGNHDNRSELLLKHEHQGMDLKMNYAKDVLQALVRLWKRPVNLHTIIETVPSVMRFDGKEHTTRQLR